MISQSSKSLATTNVIPQKEVKKWTLRRQISRSIQRNKLLSRFLNFIDIPESIKMRPHNGDGRVDASTFDENDVASGSRGYYTGSTFAGANSVS